LVKFWWDSKYISEIACGSFAVKQYRVPVAPLNALATPANIPDNALKHKT
jgi:hypothetical protein